MSRRGNVPTTPFTLSSFAKLNRSLLILGKRSDGYHEVRTVLQTISLHDDLHFALRADQQIVLSCDDPKVPIDDRNLIIRAAAALRNRHDLKSGVTIRLEKRIPVMGGLGGASSNAAVALMGLAYLWDLQTSAETLMEIGAGLGADVPFFLVGGRALAVGRGTEITPLRDGRAQYLLVVTPKSAISTAEAYRALQAPALTTGGADSILSISREEAEFRLRDQWPLHDELQNDFERVIFDIEPEIERAKEALVQVGARGALLAGSGSSVFGIFEDQKRQQWALREIQAEVGWSIFPCVTLARDDYFRSMSSSGIPRLRAFDLGF